VRFNDRVDDGDAAAWQRKQGEHQPDERCRRRPSVAKDRSHETVYRLPTTDYGLPTTD
jgi:hypothetical protein